MADPTQQPGILSSIGTGLGDLAGGVGKILPYALPVGLGLAMGAPVGMGLAGAAAGLASAEGSAGERQQQAQEMAMKEKELGIRAQEADIEIQKGQAALQDEKDRKEYAQNNINDDLAKSTGMDVKTLRQMYKDEPSTFFKTVGWGGTVHSIASHPEFLKNNPELTPDVLLALGPELGGKAFESAMSGKYPNGHVVLNNADGTTSLYGLGANGEATLIKNGVALKTIPGVDKGGADGDDKLRKAAEGQVRMDFKGKLTANKKVDDANAKLWSWQTPAPLPYPDLPSDVDDYLGSSAGEAAIRGRMSVINPSATKGAPIDPNTRLKGAIPSGSIPKDKWGQTITGPDGRKWKVDAKGNPTPA